MKRIMIMIPFCLSVTYADLSIKKIEEMVEKIHLKREGVALETLNNTKDPFVHLKKENNTTVMEVPEGKEDVALSLHAIMAGKAYINDSWEKSGDKILGYTVEYIGKKGVVLRNGNSIKKLFLGKPKDNFITLEERE